MALVSLEQTLIISLGYVATVCPKTVNATGTRVSMIRVCIYVCVYIYSFFRSLALDAGILVAVSCKGDVCIDTHGSS